MTLERKCVRRCAHEHQGVCVDIRDRGPRESYYCFEWTIEQIHCVHLLHCFVALYVHGYEEANTCGTQQGDGVPPTCNHVVGVLNLLRHCTSNQTDTLSFCLLRWLQNEVDTMCSAPYPDVMVVFLSQQWPSPFLSRLPYCGHA